MSSEGITIRQLALSGADGDTWDEYVTRHPQGAGYHRLGWLQAVAGAYRHQACPLVAENSQGQVVGVLPVCRLRKPWGASEWVSLPFCDYGGPLSDNGSVRDQLIAAALDLVRNHRGQTLDLRLPGPELDEQRWQEDAPAPAKVSMICSLPETSEALLKSYKPKLRSQIRKGEKNGLTAEVVSSEAGIRAFYPVFAANMHRLGSPVHSLDWFLKLQQAYETQMRIGLVRLEEQVVGAGIVLVSGTRASIPWASTLAEYNHLAPNMLLYWSLLADVTDQGCREFDFGRSTPDEGTYRFKKQWGAQPHELQWPSLDLQGDTLPEPEESSARSLRLRTAIETMWQRLPLAVANRLGPMLRKYISL